MEMASYSYCWYTAPIMDIMMNTNIANWSYGCTSSCSCCLYLLLGSLEHADADNDSGDDHDDDDDVPDPDSAC